MTKDEVGKFRKGERTSVKRGSEYFGRTREEKGGCVSVRLLQEKEEIAVGGSIGGGRARVSERNKSKMRGIRNGGAKEEMNDD